MITTTFDATSLSARTLATWTAAAASKATSRQTPDAISMCLTKVHLGFNSPTTRLGDCHRVHGCCSLSTGLSEMEMTAAHDRACLHPAYPAFQQAETLPSVYACIQPKSGMRCAPKNTMILQGPQLAEAAWYKDTLVVSTWSSRLHSWLGSQIKCGLYVGWARWKQAPCKQQAQARLPYQ